MSDVPALSKPLRPPLSPDETDLRTRLKAHIDMLAGLIGERNFRVFSALEAAAAYVRRQFETFGYTPIKYPYTPVSKEVVNIEADHAGETKPDQIILVGAHYDSITNCPGANDNGTGVAATLEIARLLKQRRFARTLRFVMFPHEEPPFFRTENMGSRVYAKICRDRNDDIRAMLTPETI